VALTAGVYELVFVGSVQYSLGVMRIVCLWIPLLGACGVNASIEDGRYTGAITASGCMQGQQFSIDVVAGKASIPTSPLCSTNYATNTELDYNCTVGGGETHYVCIQQGTVRDSTDVVHATLTGTNTLSGTISRTQTNYAPPNCMVTSQCADSGTFELTREK